MKAEFSTISIYFLFINILFIQLLNCYHLLKLGELLDEHNIFLSQLQ